MTHGKHSLTLLQWGTCRGFRNVMVCSWRKWRGEKKGTGNTNNVSSEEGKTVERGERKSIRMFFSPEQISTRQKGRWFCHHDRWTSSLDIRRWTKVLARTSCVKCCLFVKNTIFYLIFWYLFGIEKSLPMTTILYSIH